MEKQISSELVIPPRGYGCLRLHISSKPLFHRKKVFPEIFILQNYNQVWKVRVHEKLAMFLLDFHKVHLILSVKWNYEILAIVVYLVLFSKHPQKSAKGKLKHHILWRNVENLTKIFSFTPWIQIRIKILGQILISINIMQIWNTDPSV